MRRKLLSGYLVLLAILFGMAAILIYERQHLREAGEMMEKVHEARGHIHAVHRHVTGLALLGEGMVGWEEADALRYRDARQRTDSLLRALEPLYAGYVSPSRIDSLRLLLADKERLAFDILSLLDAQEEADSLLATLLPEMARRATRVRTVKQRRNNLFGMLGGKKTVQVFPSAKELHAFSDSIAAVYSAQAREIAEYTDSLRERNRVLNDRLNLLVGELDTRAREIIGQREAEIDRAHVFHVKIYTATLSAAIILLFLSFLAIHRELKRNADEKTKREKLIGELQESNTKNEELLRFRRNLIQNVTHELRTPLAAISGNAGLALRDTEAESRMRHIRAVDASARRMVGMVNSLLAYFRLDSGKETLNIKPFKLRSIAEILETEFAPLAAGKQLNFKVNNHADEVVSGDKNRILTIGGNLLSNAIKFTQSGTITLSTGYKDGTFTLSVEDTGTGMTVEQKEKIFTPFERLGNAVTQDGFGLGLAIVAYTVKLMEGGVSVESDPGKGSRFTAAIPLPKAEETVAEEGKKGHRRGISPNYSVLAIDNDGMLLEMLHDMYAQNGVECDTCLTVEELMDRIREKEYGLLITDLKMPEVNGYELLELLREADIGNSKTIPVIAATAAGYVKEEELKEKGFAAMLVKPYSIDELLAVTEKCAKPNCAGRIDFSSLLAFGDRRRTLERLVADTQTEMDGVRKAAEAKDIKALDDWVHHLRSSWMLMKAEQPLTALYEAIHKENMPESEVKSAIDAVLEQGRRIMEAAGKEAGRWEG